MPTILLVDDDAAFARALVSFLTRSFPGIAIVTHENAVDALDYLLSGADVALCFVDLELGMGMTGRALIERAIAARPELHGRIVVCSGDPFAAHEPLRNGCLRLDKPFDLDELRAIIDGALDG